MERPAPPATTHRRLSTWSKVLLAAFVVLVVLPYAGLPLAVRYGLTEIVAQQLHRPVSVGRIYINLYSPTLIVEQLHIGGQKPGEPFVDLTRLQVHLSWSSARQRAPIVDEVYIDGPRMHVSRLGEQRFNFSDLLTGSSSTESTDTPVPAFSVSNIRITGGGITFDDRLQGATHTVDHIALDIPLVANLSTDSAVWVKPRLEFRLDGSPFTLAGQAKPFDASLDSDLNIKLDQLDVTRYMSYVPAPLPVKLQSAKLSCDLRVMFAKTAQQPAVSLSGTVDLADVKATDASGGSPMGFAGLHLDASGIEPLRGYAHIAELRLETPTAALIRGADGSLMLLSTAASSTSEATTSPAPPTATDAAQTKDASPLDVQLDRLSIANGQIRFEDRAVPRPVVTQLDDLKLQLANVTWPARAPMDVDFATRINQQAAVSVRGKASLEPMQAQLDFELQQFDLAAFTPYVEQSLNASIQRAVLNAGGKLQVEGAQNVWKASYEGTAALDEVRMLDKKTGDLFADWGHFGLDPIRLKYGPDGVHLDVDRVALSGFEARLFLDSQGQLNLQNFIAEEGTSTSLTRTEEGTAAAKTDKPAQPEPARAKPAPAPSTASTTPTPPLNLRFGKVTFDGGHVNFTDNFIRPHYTADLTNIHGEVGTIASNSTKPSPVRLLAQLNASGPISIVGSITPLAPKPALDIKARAHDIVLRNFSPYTTKYIGFPIVKGNLDVDVRYKLDDNKLTADNHLVVQQLTFGERVESPDATKLPVQLAISLLKNSRGEIDLSLPVSGSLDDPQFSIGGVIVGALGNLVKKAITSPFTLISGMIHRPESLQYVEFAPGSAELSADAESKLQDIVKALSERPSLKLGIVGRTQADVDGPALPDVYVDQQVRKQKLIELKDRDKAADTKSLQVSPDEYGRYLAAAYKAADFKKPRNLVGLSRGLPPDEMKRLLGEHAPRTELDLGELAKRRAMSVENWLSGKLPAERVAVLEPQLQEHEGSGEGARAGVEFKLDR